jgi:outer membrane protein OmpA-like peptidoglycan-associated protein
MKRTVGLRLLALIMLLTVFPLVTAPEATAAVNINTGTIYETTDNRGTGGWDTADLAMTSEGVLYFYCWPNGTTVLNICAQPSKADNAAGSSNIYYSASSTPAIGEQGGMALDSEDHLFFSSPSSRAIFRISETNTATVYESSTAWTGCNSISGAPKKMSFKSNGDLAISMGTCGVWIVPTNGANGSTTSTGGTAYQVFTNQTSGTPTFCASADAISVDSTGNIYVGCNDGIAYAPGDRIIKLTPSGGTYTASLYYEVGTYARINGLGVDSEDTLYMMTATNFRKYLNVSGTITQYTSTYSHIFDATSITFDRQGNAYVGWDNQIVKFIGVGVPYPPTGLNGTPGNHQVTLSWKNPGLTGVDTYTVTATPGGSTCSKVTSDVSPFTCTITGLTNNQPYSFSVKSSNKTGISLSSQSITISPVGQPEPPTIGSAVAYDSHTATISFTAPTNNGGSPILRYVATSYPAGETGTAIGAGSATITITNLPTNIAETFTVVAINAYGTSLPSAVSNSITPLATTTPPAPPVSGGGISIPAPPQSSKVLSYAPISGQLGAGTMVNVALQVTTCMVTNVSVDNLALPINSWSYSSETLTILMPSHAAGKVKILIYDGCIPLLDQLDYLYQESEAVMPANVVAQQVVKNPDPVNEVNVQPTPVMRKIGIIYFASGTYLLDAKSITTLKALSLRIKSANPTVVLTYGHTDNRGGVDNTLLSKNRARATAKVLRSLLPGQKLATGWFASTKPITTGTSASDRAKNRRVEIYIK